MVCHLTNSKLIYIFTFHLTVHGGWGEWQAWATCPVTCGGADQSRTRVCNNPTPQQGGRNCTADGSSNEETQRCHENQCPGMSIPSTTW